MTNSNTILEATEISKHFHDPADFNVLDNVSFSIAKGEFIALTGKSGSGKSTLLYVLSTMDTDYRGMLCIDDELVTGKSPGALASLRSVKIGFVFQFHYLLGDFTCLQNVMIPALRLGSLPRQKIEDSAYQKLRALGLQDQALKKASKLSGGQQQRVAIARALINDPLIVMCDEPTGNLDSTNTAIVLELFRQLSGQGGQTIIAVTHDQDFAGKADRTIEMIDGRI